MTIDVKLTGITDKEMIAGGDLDELFRHITFGDSNAKRPNGDAIGVALATILKTAFYLSGTAYFITQLVG